jgi:hypothetical protein
MMLLGSRPRKKVGGQPQLDACASQPGENQLIRATLAKSGRAREMYVTYTAVATKLSPLGFGTGRRRPSPRGTLWSARRQCRNCGRHWCISRRAGAGWPGGDPPPGSDVGIPGATRARRTQEGSSPGTAVQTTLISNSAPASSNGAPALNSAVL